jgi:hypothetical protein
LQSWQGLLSPNHWAIEPSHERSIVWQLSIFALGRERLTDKQNVPARLDLFSHQFLMQLSGLLPRQWF